MRSARSWSSIAPLLALSWGAQAGAAPVADGPVEQWVDVPLPPGFRVESSELEGPVFADASGRTLYTWPLHAQRNGYSGESPGTPACYDEVLTVTAGLMSPYPPGIELPELDTRPSCTDLWPPVVAADGAEPVGDWTIVVRRDGTRQWAYEEQPVYTSVRDREPGDVLGGSKRNYGGDSPAYRVPIGPPSAVAPGFAVHTTAAGRLLTTDRNESVYAYDGDTSDKSNCRGSCSRLFRPVLAPALAQPRGEWSIIERSPGELQWTYRGEPLYTHPRDQQSWSLQGSDEPGWHNVYAQKAPPYPAAFTVQTTLAGDVLADAAGMTIYRYNCGDDSQDQLSCDHPDDTQVYRLAMCGGGDPARCLEFWPYVRAGEGDTGRGRSWSVIRIDPATGHKAGPEDEGAIRVWAYRDRPVYTYAGDRKPGDTHGDGTGEWRGQRNGLRAFWLREEFMGGTQ